VGISVICARNACDLCPVAYNCIRMHLYTFHCIAFNINCIYHWMHWDALNYIYNWTHPMYASFYICVIFINYNALYAMLHLCAVALPCILDVRCIVPHSDTLTKCCILIHLWATMHWYAFRCIKNMLHSIFGALWCLCVCLPLVLSAWDMNVYECVHMNAIIILTF
jgi:hypothetical protein